MIFIWKQIGLGLLLALATLFVSFMMTGGGHGWITPLWFSLAGLVLCPAAFLRFAEFDVTRQSTNIALIITAIVLDALLVKLTLDEGLIYFHRVGGMAYIWIALWSLWQVLAVMTALRR